MSGRWGSQRPWFSGVRGGGWTVSKDIKRVYHLGIACVNGRTSLSFPILAHPSHRFWDKNTQLFTVVVHHDVQVVSCPVHMQILSLQLILFLIFPIGVADLQTLTNMKLKILAQTSNTIEYLLNECQSWNYHVALFQKYANSQ